MPCKAVNNHSNLDYDKYKPLFDDFFPYSRETLGYKTPFSLNLMSDEKNATDPLGKTAHYDPNKLEISVYVDGRHIKDILRSVAHELVHHLQNERGDFDGQMNTGPGYAQEDGHLREMELEAYREGNIMLRDWEDGYKVKKRKKESLYENRQIRIKVKRR